MSDYEKFANPPAIEAIFDVGVFFPGGIDPKVLAACHDVFKDAYPIREEQRVIEFGVEQPADGPPRPLTQDHGVSGYQFIAENRTELVQCKRDGFSFNRLRPYPGWEEASTKARRAWELYRETFPQAQVTRVALRYINQILVPVAAERVQMEKYFSVHPPCPALPSLNFNGFMSQAHITDSETALEANWIFARYPHPDPTILSIVLDIDVFVQGEKAVGTDVAGLWETMRELKNRLFFGTVTETTKIQFR